MQVTQEKHPYLSVCDERSSMCGACVRVYAPAKMRALDNKLLPARLFGITAAVL